MTVNLRSDVGTESTLSSVPAFPGHQNDLPVRAPCSDPPRDPTRDTRGNDPTSNVLCRTPQIQLPGAQTRAAQSPRLSHEWWNKSLTSNVYQCCCISYIIDLLYNSAVHEPPGRPSRLIAQDTRLHSSVGCCRSSRCECTQRACPWLLTHSMKFLSHEVREDDLVLSLCLLAHFYSRRHCIILVFFLLVER